jgi:hypothetical protein
MPTGEREQRWSRRKRLRLEGLEDRIALNSTFLNDIPLAWDFNSSWQQLITQPASPTVENIGGPSGSADQLVLSGVSGESVAPPAAYLYSYIGQYWWYRLEWYYAMAANGYAADDLKGDHESKGQSDLVFGNNQNPDVPVISDVPAIPVVAPASGNANSGGHDDSSRLTVGLSTGNRSANASLSVSTSTLSDSSTTQSLVVSVHGVTLFGTDSALASGKAVSHPSNGQTDKVASPSAVGPTSLGPKAEPELVTPVQGVTLLAEATSASVLLPSAAPGIPANHTGGAPGELTPLDGRKLTDLVVLGRAWKVSEMDVGILVAPAPRTEVTGPVTVEPAAEAAEPAAFPAVAVAREVIYQVLPQGAAQLLDQLPIDARAVDQAVQQFVLQLDNLGEQISQAPKGISLLSWAVLGAVATTTLRSARRRRRKKRPDLHRAGLSDDSLSWMTDPDSSHSGGAN